MSPWQAQEAWVWADSEVVKYVCHISCLPHSLPTCTVISCLPHSLPTCTVISCLPHSLPTCTAISCLPLSLPTCTLSPVLARGGKCRRRWLSCRRPSISSCGGVIINQNYKCAQQFVCISSIPEQSENYNCTCVKTPPLSNKV